MAARKGLRSSCDHRLGKRQPHIGDVPRGIRFKDITLDPLRYLRMTMRLARLVAARQRVYEEWCGGTDP